MGKTQGMPGNGHPFFFASIKNQPSPEARVSAVLRRGL
jgi:hypothetical protein